MPVVSPLPAIIQHGRNALPGHIGYRPGHPLNPYSPMGLWYYVPRFNAKHRKHVSKMLADSRIAPAIDRSHPYFGLDNVQDYLNDLAMHEPVATPFSAGVPVQRTLPTSGVISLSAIHALFGRGLNLNAYRGTRWYTDTGAYGDFPTGAIGLHNFYGKRPDDPVVAGAWDQQGTGYYDFYTPIHRNIGTQRVAGGGGSGGFNGRGDSAGQTWAFPGGSPINGGTGGGYLYGNGINAYWTDQEYQGQGGTWGAAGNSNNIAGTAGGTVGGGINIYTFTTGAGGNSAWAAGGVGQTCAIGSGAVNGANGVFGSGGGGGMNNNGGGLYYWGDGGGGAGYTYDYWGQGVIGGVVNIYVAPGAAGRQGGWGGNGRVYVAWS